MNRKPQIDYRNLLLLVEQTTQEVIRGAFPRSWNEDHITQSILSALIARVPTATITGVDRPFTVGLDAFKAHGIDVRGPLQVSANFSQAACV